jgi:hypothetical protein
MNSILAAGLFDNPWIVAVIILGGALVNWLSQRRQAKQQEHQPEEDAAPSPKKAQGEFDMEATLRRLLGEQSSPPAPAPPPIPRPPQGQRPPPPPVWSGGPTTPPVRTWMEDSNEASKPVRLPPAIAVARPVATSLEFDTSSEQAALRFEQLNEQGRHPATVIDHGHTRRTRTGAKSALWRDRKSVRRAFVASLVFGPPKGLES